MNRARLSYVALLCCLTVLIGCARHGQDEIKGILAKWFALGDPVYYFSNRGCSAAVYELRNTEAKSALRVETEIQRAFFTFERTGTMALKLKDQSPDQAFLEVMNTQRSVGVYVQQAAIEGRDCMDETTEGAFHAALSNPSALFVWSRDEAALVLMDPDQKMVFFASGSG